MNESIFDNLTCPIINLNNYTCSDKGLILPLVCEFTWPWIARVIIYFVGMLWCFLGVAIIADIFMCSIEKITSHVRIIKVASDETESGFEELEVKVWNDTVANLTLMALGSSAPEILLACIEIIGKGFLAGELGPGTIVGSAAFNLFTITGICIAAIPNNEVRKIESFKVFCLTSLFSLLAYVWLVVVIVLITPNQVQIWEAVLTLAFFPILVILAYTTDKGCFTSSDSDTSATEIALGHKSEQIISSSRISKAFSKANKLSNYLPWNTKKKHRKRKRNEERLRQIAKELIQQHPDLSEDEIFKLASLKFADEQPKNRLWYRINAAKQLGGSSKLIPTGKFGKVIQRMKEAEEDGRDGYTLRQGGVNAVLELSTTQCAIMERDQKVTITIFRYGNMSNTVSCRIETIDGTAEAVKDYIAVKEELTFEPNETEKDIDIVIIDDDEWEPDEIFFVKLSLDPELTQDAVVGPKAIQEVTILNDDEPGIFEFEKPSFVFNENVGYAQIPVIRNNGADGKVTLSWKTEDITAVESRDYQGKEGILIFETGELKKNIEILICNDKVMENDESFKIILVKADPEGAKLGRIRKTIVTIVNDDEFNTVFNKFLAQTNVNADAFRIETMRWSDQFKSAMNVNGGDLEGATSMDYIMHLLTFWWKFMFAFIPPTSIWKGWLTFFISLAAIGLLTAIVGDLAAIFGCLVGLKDSVTAITFVALGTSLPDLFASKQAATMEKTADNSIGNVTGSNSVNVFLGLGLPWVFASIYWAIKGKPFIVEAGDLAFSVVVFVVLAVFCMLIFLIRRYTKFFGRAELGGPWYPKIFSAVVIISMWFIYATLSSLRAYSVIHPNF